MRQRGFTLLEMLVATFIMGVAVIGLLSNISLSMHTAERLTAYDRAALLARHKMDELLLAPRLPKLAVFGGAFDPAVTGGVESGWSARVTPFEQPPRTGPGVDVLERVELEVWWMSGSQRKKVGLEGFRRITLTPADLGEQP